MHTKSMIRLSAAVAAAILAAPGIAHHSSAMFDRTKEQVLTGTVREFQWTAPHVWIQLDVPAGQKTVLWGIESTNPMALGRQGWKRTSFKPGDKITVTVHPHRNGKPVAEFVKATLADGSTLGGPLAANLPKASAGK